MEREAGTCAVTMLLCSLTVAIAVLAMTGVAIAQQNNFVLSSSAFADNGTMAQKYMGKILLTPTASVKTFRHRWNGAMPPLLHGATRSSCTIRKAETVWVSAIGSPMASMVLRPRYPRERVTVREPVSSVAVIFFAKDHTMAAARQRGPGRTTTCSR